MTEQFERLKKRFGADVAAWPAPHRQEAQALLADTTAGRTADRDAALDRLILDAAAAETYEIALTRKVLARINAERKPAMRPRGLLGLWSMPAAASGFAALLLVAAIGGYLAAGDGPGMDGMDDALLAFALGDGGAGDLLDGFGGEDQL
jgi:hypothetical protein